MPTRVPLCSDRSSRLAATREFEFAGVRGLWRRRRAPWPGPARPRQRENPSGSTRSSDQRRPLPAWDRDAGLRKTSELLGARNRIQDTRGPGRKTVGLPLKTLKPAHESIQHRLADRWGARETPRESNLRAGETQSVRSDPEMRVNKQTS